MPALYIPDIRLETYGRYYLSEIGFLTVAGGLSMAWFQWKLNLWIWCSGVWPMNCFGRNRCHFGCVALGWSGSEIQDHSDHGRSNELINFCPEWSHHCIWSSWQASSPIRPSETSLARTHEQASSKAARGPSLAHSREAHFTCPNRRACSQAIDLPWSKWSRTTYPDPDHLKRTHS